MLSRIARSMIIALLVVLTSTPLDLAYTAPDKAFTVNSTIDTVDKNPGDGTCVDAGGKCSLRAAVMETNSLVGPDTIILPSETYSMTITPVADDDAALTGDLDITGELIINGSGAENTVIDGTDMGDRLFDIQAGELVTITGVTVQKGFAFNGGGIRNRGTLAVLDCHIGPNKASNGAGIYNDNNATLRINNCLVGGNKATGAGGGINNSGELYVDNSKVRETGRIRRGIGNYEGSAHLSNKVY